MSDLEQRLTEALTEGSRAAPAPSGLAAAARSRARDLWRRRLAVAGVAAATALAVGVPTGLAISGGDDPAPRHHGTGVATQPAASDSAPPGVPRGGFHWESWRDVTIQVPDDWHYGSLSDWCAAGGELEPRVQRPGAVSNDILCEPASTYGLTFQEIDNADDFTWPVVHQDDGGWPRENVVGGRGIGGVLVMVATPDADLANYILSTMRSIGPKGDPNGCTSSRGEAPRQEVPAGAMRICRYDDRGFLEQSEVLDDDETERAVAALEAAPEIPADETCPRNVTDVEPIVRLDSADLSVNVDLGGDCPTVHGAGPDRQLTPDVLYWALSPGWSGSVPGDVSLPSELRTR